MLLIAKSEFGHARAQGILMNLQVTLWNIIQRKLEHGIVLFSMLMAMTYAMEGADSSC